MGRPSKLTDVQWEQIEKRLLMGESLSSLAKEFKISKSVISGRFSNRLKTVKDVANQILETEVAISKLTVSERYATFNLVDECKAMTMHLASGAKLNASTFHRLAGIANMKMQEIDDARPFDDESREAVKDVMMVLRTGNEASVAPLTLAKINKELAQTDDEPTPVAIQFNTKDCRRDDGNNT